MYTIKYEPFLDLRDDKSYKNIVTINRLPQGPLRSCVIRVRRNKLSTLSATRGRSCESICLFAFTQNIYNIEDSSTGDCGCADSTPSFSSDSSFLCVEQIPDLLTIASENNYTVDYRLSKLLTNSGVASNNALGSKYVCSLSYVTPEKIMHEHSY